MLSKQSAELKTACKKLSKQGAELKLLAKSCRSKVLSTKLLARSYQSMIARQLTAISTIAWIKTLLVIPIIMARVMMGYVYIYIYVLNTKHPQSHRYEKIYAYIWTTKFRINRARMYAICTCLFHDFSVRIYLFIGFIFQKLHMFVCLSACLSVFVCLSVCLSFCQSVYAMHVNFHRCCSSKIQNHKAVIV